MQLAANYAAIVFAFITLGIVLRDGGRRTKLMYFLHNKTFLGGILAVIIWSFFSLREPATTEEDKKNQAATKQAIIALIIALLSELHLSIAPFWLVWIASYYLNIG